MKLKCKVNKSLFVFTDWRNLIFGINCYQSKDYMFNRNIMGFNENLIDKHFKKYFV